MAPSNDMIYLRAMAELCEEIRALRDDLYNHALLTNPAAFAGSAPLTVGQRQFTTGEMPTADNTAGSAQVKVFANQSNRGVAAVVRCEPNWTNLPPNPIALENTFLILALSPDEATSADSILEKYSAGDPVCTIIPPNKTLYVAVMASASVFATWRVYPLRGRRLAYEVE